MYDITNAINLPIRIKISLPRLVNQILSVLVYSMYVCTASKQMQLHIYDFSIYLWTINRQQSSSMATKRVRELCTPFSKLYRRNVSALNTITQRMYATVNEGDTQVTHTGQVSYPSFALII